MPSQWKLNFYPHSYGEKLYFQKKYLHFIYWFKNKFETFHFSKDLLPIYSQISKIFNFQNENLITDNFLAEKKFSIIFVDESLVITPSFYKTLRYKSSFYNVYYTKIKKKLFKTTVNHALTKTTTLKHVLSSSWVFSLSFRPKYLNSGTLSHIRWNHTRKI